MTLPKVICSISRLLLSIICSPNYLVFAFCSNFVNFDSTSRKRRGIHNILCYPLHQFWGKFTEPGSDFILLVKRTNDSLNCSRYSSPFLSHRVDSYTLIILSFCS